MASDPSNDAAGNSAWSRLCYSSWPSYLAVHPVGLRSAIRLWAGYGASLGVRAVRPRSAPSVGGLIPGRLPVTVSVLGFKALVRPGTNDLDLLAHHEPATLEWFRVRPGDFVVDVGAHIGRYTLVAAQRGATVVSIEPDSANFDILEANVRLNGFSSVFLKPMAVSDSNGPRAFYPSRDANRGTSSLVRRRPRGRAESAEGEVVDCKRLDDILEIQGLQRIDWLKVDVEGHELEVLRGARESLSMTRHLALEVTSTTESACRDLTERAGFRLEAEERGHPATNLLMGKGE